MESFLCTAEKSICYIIQIPPFLLGHVVHLKYIVQKCCPNEVITCPYASKSFDLLSPYILPQCI